MKAALPRWHSGKEPVCQCTRYQGASLGPEDPLGSKQQPTPVFLPGKFYGHGHEPSRLIPWGRKQSDVTEMQAM